MEFIPPNTKFNFMKYRRFFVGISLACMAASVVLLFTKGLNYGIDFRGGVELQYQFSQEVSIAEIRTALEKAGKAEATVQKVQGISTYDYLISFQLDETEKGSPAAGITPVLTQIFPNTSVNLRKVDSIGPRVGADLKKAAILSMLYASLLMLVYLWFRFNITFSTGAVLAILHDVVVTMGVVIWFQIEFNLSTVAALLTIMGYSINDTIVTFDRARENLVHMGKLSFENILDRSVNECLSRTILTSSTVFIVVVVLLLLGGPTLYPFSFTMTVGVVTGTYSSIYIASPIALWMDNWLSTRKESRKLVHAK